MNEADGKETEDKEKAERAAKRKLKFNDSKLDEIEYVEPPNNDDEYSEDSEYF